MYLDTIKTEDEPPFPADVKVHILWPSKLWLMLFRPLITKQFKVEALPGWNSWKEIPLAVVELLRQCSESEESSVSPPFHLLKPEGMFWFSSTLLLTVINRKQNAKKTTKDLLNLKQMITITGLGSPSFAKNISRLDKLMNVLYNSSGSTEIVPLEIVAYEGHPTVHAQNRSRSVLFLP